MPYPIFPETLRSELVSRRFDQGALIQTRFDELIQDAQQLAARFQASETEQEQQEIMDARERLLQRNDELSIAQGGVCQCLVLKWLQTKMDERADGLSGKKKVAPDTRMDALSSPEVLSNAVKAQAKAGTTEGAQLQHEKLDVAQQEYGMQSAPNGTYMTSNESQVANEVTKTPHSYFLCGITFTVDSQSGAHAIGFYQSGGKLFGTKKHVYLFDPNFGEFKFKSGDFTGKLTTFLGESYGGEISFLRQYSNS